MVRKNWSKIGFGEVVSLSKSRHNPKTSNNSYPCIELEHIEQGTGRIIGNTPSSSLNSTKSKFKKGDVIFGKLRPYLRKYAMPSFNGVCSTEIWVFKPSDKILKPYLYHLIQTSHFISEANKSSGSKMPRADWAVISEMVISLPPLPEQQKIAKILTTWDKAIDTTERLIDNSKQQKKALMQQLLTGKKRLLDDNGKPFEGEWGKEILKNLGKVFIGLVTTMTKSYVDDGIPLIRNSDIKPNHITKEKMLSLCEEFATKHENRKLREGDVVTVHTGEVGVSAVIDRELDGCIGFATLNTRPDTERLNPHFLSWYFNSEYFINWCVSMSTGDGRQNLNLKDFVKAEIPLPSLDEQKKIVSVLTNADKEIELLEQQLADLQQEKKALMQVLLTGKVRVKV